MSSIKKRKGLLHQTGGRRTLALTRDAEQITMLDIYRAIEGKKPLLHMDIHTNPECGVGVNIQLAIGDFYREIQDAAEKKMQEITLRDIIDIITKKQRYRKASGCKYCRSRKKIK